MQFLKTLFWVIVAVVAVLFASTNWQPVTLKLWGGLVADVKLPVLVIVAFLLGFLPTLIVYRARLWSLRRRLETQAHGPCRQPSRAGAAGHADDQHARPAGDRRQGLAGRMTSPIYVAIDTPDLDRAKAIAAKVRAHVGGIKLGLEFYSANGPDGVRAMAALDLPIFLDLKLHDIPNTVAKAVQALHPLAAGDPHRPCRRRPGDDGGRQGGGAVGHQGGRRHRADQPRRGRPRRDRRRRRCRTPRWRG